MAKISNIVIILIKLILFSFYSGETAMSPTIAELAAAIAIFLAPYGVEEDQAIATKAGGTAAEKASQLWKKLSARAGQPEELDLAARRASADLTDPGAHADLAKALVGVLRKDPDLASELVELLGGEIGVQRIAATHHSLVENITQELSDAGEQIIKAQEESTVRSAHQVARPERGTEAGQPGQRKQSLTAESGSTVENVVQFSGTAIFQLLEKAPLPLSRLMYVEKYRTLVEERTRRFVGRDFIFQAIDQHLQDQEFTSGYILIRGEPGIGKTSLAAHLVKTRGFVHHFNIATQNIRTVQNFLYDVCAQLIVRYQLEHDRVPEEAASDSAFLSQLLAEAAAKQENLPVILLVDALDEAEQFGLGSLANHLYLPQTLPEGVYFILTSREQVNYRLLVDRRQDIYLSDDDPQNIADIGRYIVDFIQEHQEVMETRIRQWGLEPGDFVEQLAEKSQGNFMYLVHVLQDIRAARLTEENLDNLADLPLGLQEYYSRHWEVMRADDPDRFDRLYEPVVCVLAAVREPVTVDKVVGWTKLSRSQVKGVINEWRQFLNEEKGQGELLYRVYHTSFQDFLQEEVGLERFHNMIAQSALDKIPGFDR
jgi:hypothetical protein